MANGDRSAPLYDVHLASEEPAGLGAGDPSSCALESRFLYVTRACATSPRAGSASPCLQRQSLVRTDSHFEESLEELFERLFDLDTRRDLGRARSSGRRIVRHAALMS